VIHVEYIYHSLLNIEHAHRVYLYQNSAQFVCGFRSSEFLVVDLSSNAEVARLNCGGWRRPIDLYVEHEDPHLGFTLIFSRADILHCVFSWNVQESKKSEPLIKSMHGLRINDMALISSTSEGSERVLIATAGEDTVLRLNVMECDANNGFWSVIYSRKIDSHLSSLTCVLSTKTARSQRIFFSGGGRNELLCWSLYNLQLAQKDNFFNFRFCLDAQIIERTKKKGSATLRITALGSSCCARIAGCWLFVGRSSGELEIIDYVPRLEVANPDVRGSIIRRMFSCTGDTGALTCISVCDLVDKMKPVIFCVSGDTGGYLRIWSVVCRNEENQEDVSVNLCTTERMHLSGINALNVWIRRNKESNGFDLWIGSGGDDEMLRVVSYAICFSSDNVHPELDMKCTSELRAHCAAIVDLKPYSTTSIDSDEDWALLSLGADQKLIHSRISQFRSKTPSPIQIVDIIHINIPDCAAVSLNNPHSNQGSRSAFVAGYGLEALTVINNRI